MAKKEKIQKESFKEQLSSMFELPTDIIDDIPKIVMLGNKEIHIENFISLIEYTEQKIRVSTKSGILIIDGIKLEAKKMTADYLWIKGTILQISFVQ